MKVPIEVLVFYLHINCLSMETKLNRASIYLHFHLEGFENDRSVSSVFFGTLLWHRKKRLLQITQFVFPFSQHIAKLASLYATSLSFSYPSVVCIHTGLTLLFMSYLICFILFSGWVFVHLLCVYSQYLRNASSWMLISTFLLQHWQIHYHF